MMTQLTKMLDIGTQELLMREAYDAHCRCGKSLTWTMSGDEYGDTTATTDCECGMAYVALLPTMKIEGIDTKTL